MKARGIWAISGPLLRFAVNRKLKKHGSVRSRICFAEDDFGDSWAQYLKKPRKRVLIKFFKKRAYLKYIYFIGRGK